MTAWEKSGQQRDSKGRSAVGPVLIATSIQRNSTYLYIAQDATALELGIKLAAKLGRAHAAIPGHVRVRGTQDVNVLFHHRSSTTYNGRSGRGTIVNTRSTYRLMAHTLTRRCDICWKRRRWVVQLVRPFRVPWPYPRATKKFTQATAANTQLHLMIHHFKALLIYHRGATHLAKPRLRICCKPPASRSIHGSRMHAPWTTCKETQGWPARLMLSGAR